MDRASGTEGYGETADALVEHYEGLTFADVHRDTLHLIPKTPGRVLDIGAGTGRDAAALAALDDALHLQRAQLLLEVGATVDLPFGEGRHGTRLRLARRVVSRTCR